jgi:membrane protein required for colicin V production
MMIDIICLLAYVYAFYKGLKNGLILAVFSLAAYILAYFIAKHFSNPIASWVKAFSGSESKWMPVIVYVVLFIAVLLLVRMSASLLEKGLSLLSLGIFNKIGGVVFYLASLTVFLWFVFSVMFFLISPSSETFTGSFFYKHVFSQLPSLKELIRTI